MKSLHIERKKKIKSIHRPSWTTVERAPRIYTKKKRKKIFTRFIVRRLLIICERKDKTKTRSLQQNIWFARRFSLDKSHLGSIFMTSAIYISPKVNTWSTLVKISLVNSSNSALWEKDSNEWRVFTSRPVFDGEDQWVSVMLWWIGKLYVAVERDLKWENNRNHREIF